MQSCEQHREFKHIVVENYKIFESSRILGNEETHLAHLVDLCANFQTSGVKCGERLCERKEDRTTKLNSVWSPGLSGKIQQRLSKLTFL